MLSHINAYFGASSFALSLTRGLRCEADLRLCSFLPMIYHIGGQVFGMPVLLSGGIDTPTPAERYNPPPTDRR